ncbi:MAG: hypothetical protein J5889_07285 [Clostridia bacterium]|nr:hypothetical protein [Clostridia bacterium]
MMQISSALQAETVTEETDDKPDINEHEPGGRSRENPEASAREYDENAPVEIVSGTERKLNSEGEGDGSGADGDETAEPASRIDDQAEETALQTVAVSEAEDMGVSPDADPADSVLTYYTVFLQDRMGSLFECQRGYVYWESKENYLTIYKTSLEHELILNAGAYDVSARLLSDNLHVDDGWIVRKNPDVIVKAVDHSVLGSGVHSSSAAKTVYGSIVARNGFRDIGAVKNKRVLLVSEELLKESYLQTFVMLLIAVTANEEVMSDIDIEEALARLSEEAIGTMPSGMYYYSGKEE